jgi:hypothetical protein
VRDLLTRVWENLVNRVGGPMTFRIILQPMMAALLALRAGLKDAREGRPPYFWTIFADPAQRGELLREGWKAVARVLALALIMDAIYQLIVLRWFYPGEALLVGILLAIVPYILIRGPVNRMARRWRRRTGRSEGVR